MARPLAPTETTVDGDSREAPVAPDRPRLRVLVRCLALIVVLAAAAVGVVAVRAYEHRRAENAASSGMIALRSAVPAILSYDHRRLDTDFAVAAHQLSDELRADFLEATEETIGPAATRDKIVVRSSVAAIGLVAAEPDRVVALAFVDQVTTSSRQADPVLDHKRIRFTIEKSAGRWLVTSADTL